MWPCQSCQFWQITLVDNGEVLRTGGTTNATSCTQGCPGVHLRFLSVIFWLFHSGFGCGRLGTPTGNPTPIRVIGGFPGSAGSNLSPPVGPKSQFHFCGIFPPRGYSEVNRQQSKANINSRVPCARVCPRVVRQVPLGRVKMQRELGSSLSKMGQSKSWLQTCDCLSSWPQLPCQPLGVHLCLGQRSGQSWSSWTSGQIIRKVRIMIMMMSRMYMKIISHDLLVE